MSHGLLFSITSLPTVRRMLGPHRVASFLREQEWDIEVLDFVEQFSIEEIKEYCALRITSATKFCGFSAFFGVWTKTYESITTWIKETYPDVKIIWGSHSYPWFDSNSIDYYVVGYGENAIVKLLSNSEVKFDERFKDKKVVSALDVYTSYPMKSLNVIYQDRDFIESWEWLSIELSRGCKFKCKFCNFPILGVRSDYSRDAEDFGVQLKDAYERFGVTNYYVADETFNDSTDKLEKFASVADTLKFKPRMHGFIRADLLVAQKQQWEPLNRLGFYGHYYGVETFNQKSGSSIGKGMHPDKLKNGLLEAREWFKSNDTYRGVISLICGLPHESIDSFNAGIDWCYDNWKGENTTIFSLDIPTDDKDVKLSYISLNYEKLGYREATVPYHKNIEQNFGYGRSLLNWENDYMNLETADEIVSIANKRISSVNGINMWQFGDYGLVTDDLNKISKLNKSSNPSPNRELESFYERYKRNKIKL